MGIDQYTEADVLDIRKNVQRYYQRDLSQTSLDVLINEMEIVIDKLLKKVNHLDEDNGELRKRVVELEKKKYHGTVLSHAVEAVLQELDKACYKFPYWPTDPLHALGIINEEVGELNKVVLQACYEPHKNGSNTVQHEATQAAAMCIRYLEHITDYKYKHSPMAGEE